MTALTPEVEVGDAPTALYRLFDAEGALLYVGITETVKARFAQHANDKSWWPQVARKTVEWHGTREAAALAEAQAIRTENPARNVQGHPDAESRKRRSPRRSYTPGPAPAAGRDADGDGPMTIPNLRTLGAMLDAHVKALAACGVIEILDPSAIQFPHGAAA